MGQEVTPQEALLAAVAQARVQVYEHTATVATTLDWADAVAQDGYVRHVMRQAAQTIRDADLYGMVVLNVGDPEVSLVEAAAGFTPPQTMRNILVKVRTLCVVCPRPDLGPPSKWTRIFGEAKL